MGFNKVILIGNMTADPELKQTASGIPVCAFSIAVNRRFAKDGDQTCDFINIQTWRQQAEFVNRYFTKGKPILVCGQLQTRTWTDKDGNKRYSTEVVADEVSFVGGKETNTEQKNEPSANGDYVPAAYTGTQNSGFEEIPNDSDLPF